MDIEDRWESSSLQWIHRVREAHYRETRDQPLKTWLRPPDPAEALRACERLGLKVRLGNTASPQGRRRR